MSPTDTDDPFGWGDPLDDLLLDPPEPAPPVAPRPGQRLRFHPVTADEAEAWEQQQRSDYLDALHDVAVEREAAADAGEPPWW